jgi:hypothetical protein
MSKIIFGVNILLCSTLTAFAVTHNSMKSCYDLAKIEGKSTAINKELFVLIDQTTSLDDELKQSVIQNSVSNVNYGNAFTVAKFSAFVQGNYSGVVNSAQLDWPLKEDIRNDTPKKLLQGYDKCMKSQVGYAKKTLDDSVSKTFGASTNTIVRSDILKSLQELAKNTVKTSSAKQKTVFIVSDMLENSSITSFYHKNGVKKIDPVAELKIVEANKMFADFGGANVYVLGAGLVPAVSNVASDSYRDPKTMNALQEFWKMYFKKSNAKLIEFGQPALLNIVK